MEPGKGIALKDTHRISAAARRRAATAASDWPEGETLEALEDRETVRAFGRDVAGTLLAVSLTFATWQGLAAYAVAVHTA